MVTKSMKWAISDLEFEQQYTVATQRGKREVAKGAYAVTARFDKATKRIVVDLANGATLMVPAHLIQGLQGASAKDLAEIEILGAGTGLFWPKLAIDSGVMGLLSGVFGTRVWMAELGRAGGRAKSVAKRAASKANGRLGGRPRKAESKSTNRKPNRAA